MKRYIPLIFMEGATVMAVELCGAKLMAPVFGSSLHVWASILAITLFALAGGYFYGGVVSGKKDPKISLRNVLYFASVFTALMPFISIFLLPIIAFLWFQAAVIAGAMALIFLPVFFMGCTSPLFVRLNAHNVNESGLISGKVYALSTLGGIVSTFLCGFIFIPYFGLKATLLVYAVLLIIITLLTLEGFKLKWLGVFLLSFSVSLLSNNSFGNVIYSEHGIMGHVEVVDVTEEGIQKRQLLVNKTVQTEMNLKSKKALSGYLNLLDSVIPLSQTGVKNGLLLGLGGGLVANLMVEKNFSVTGVEFDKRIIYAAKEFFFLDKRIKTESQDARYFLNNSKEIYDVVIMDLFKAEEQPGYIISLESLLQLKKNLSANAIVVVNWHGYTSLPNGLGTKVLEQTFSMAGYEGKSTATSSNEEYSNRVFVYKMATSAITKLENYPVNSDDCPFLEYANARANLSWRKNYLRYWQQTR